MIRFLKNNQFGTLLMVLALLTGFAIVLHGLDANIVSKAGNTPFTLWIQQVLPEMFGTESNASFVLVICLILFQSVLFGIVAERNHLLYKKTWLPVLFFGIFNMVFPIQLSLHASLLANTFLVLAVMTMFRAQGRENAMPALMNSGMLCGLAFLFSPGTFLLIPVFLLGITFFKPIRGLDFLQYLTGYALILFFGITLLYLFGMEEVVAEYMQMDYLQAGDSNFLQDPYFLGFTLFMVLIFIVTFVRLQQNFFRNTVQVRKLQQFLLLYLVFSLLFSFFGIESVQGAMSVLALPLSVFLTYFFLPAKRIWLQELIFWVFLFAIFSQHIHLF